LKSERETWEEADAPPGAARAARTRPARQRVIPILLTVSSPLSSSLCIG